MKELFNLLVKTIILVVAEAVLIMTILNMLAPVFGFNDFYIGFWETCLLVIGCNWILSYIYEFFIRHKK